MTATNNTTDNTHHFDPPCERAPYGSHSKPERTTYGAGGAVEYVHSRECLAACQLRCGQTCRGGFGVAEARALELTRQAMHGFRKPWPRPAKMLCKLSELGIKGVNPTLRDVIQLMNQEEARRPPAAAQGNSGSGSGGKRRRGPRKGGSAACEAAREMLRADPARSRVEIAGIVGLSHQRISQIARDLRREEESA